MKAKDYAKSFKASIGMFGSTPDQAILVIVKDMIKEVNLNIVRLSPKTPEDIAFLWNQQIKKWEEMSDLLKKHMINREGLLQIIKEKKPQMYFTLVAHGMKRLKEDEVPLEPYQGNSENN